MNVTLPMIASALLMLLAPAQRPAVTLDLQGEPHMVEPPGEPVGDAAERLSQAKKALEGGTSTADVLADARFTSLRPYTQFRELIRTHAKSSKASLIPRDEPGAPLVVIGHVAGADGKPVADALVYAYQTSSKGWYAAEAPHISGNSGDTKHARLFAYVRSASDGTFGLRTVRPGGYPRSTLPQHIHLAIEANAGRLWTEIVFDDDPRLTSEAREEARKSKFVVVKTAKLDDGIERCTAELVLTRQ
jgi:protocatechuate 3,4-dioxygenase beta subunit